MGSTNDDIYQNRSKMFFWCLNISFDIIHDLYRLYRPIENFDENCQKWRFLAIFEKKYTMKQKGILFTKMKIFKIFDRFHQNFQSVYMVDIWHVWYQMRCLDTKRLIFERF